MRPSLIFSTEEYCLVPQLRSSGHICFCWAFNCVTGCHVFVFVRSGKLVYLSNTEFLGSSTFLDLVLCEPKYTLPLTGKGYSVIVSEMGDSLVGKGQNLGYLG